MKEILDFNVLWNFFPYEYVSATLLEILKKKKQFRELVTIAIIEF